MAYKKYIIRDGKKFGPYYYKSIKKDGRVITEYLGTSTPKKSNSVGKIKKTFLVTTSIAIIILMAFFIFISNFNFSGKATISIENSYISGENLYGNLFMSLEENEFIPASAKILINNSGQEQEFFLEDVINQEPAQGNFYIKDKNISGFGDGYGFNQDYPVVSFVLNIFSESKEENITIENETIEINETESNINQSDSISSESDIDKNVTEIKETLSEPSSKSSESDIDETPQEIPTETPTQAPQETTIEETPTKTPTKTPGESPKEDKPKTTQEKNHDKKSEVKEKTKETIAETTTETSQEETPTETTSEPSINEGESVSDEPNSKSSKSGTDETPQEPTGITGNIIKGILKTASKVFLSLTGYASLELEKQITGEVSKNNSFSYDLNEGQTATINFSAQDINLNIENNQIIVTTNYIGEQNKNEFNINLSNLNLTAREGEINIKLIYNDIEITSITQNISVENETKLNETANATITETTKSYPIIINHPVKWIKDIKIENKNENSSNILTEIPKQAQGVINIKKGKSADDELIKMLEYEKAIENQSSKLNFINYKINTNNQVNEVDIQNLENEITDFVRKETTISAQDTPTITGKVSLQIDLNKEEGIAQKFWKNLKGVFTGNVISNLNFTETSENIIVNISDEVQSANQNDTIILEYYTEAPQSFEEEMENGKRITISASDNLNYTNILAYTQLNNSDKIKNPRQIRVLWDNNETGIKESVSFSTNDLDEEGNIDYVEWVVPHLSNQTYEIILITKAEHLNQSKEFISDIYNEVVELDGNFSEPINSNEYVRVTFEMNLTSSNDISFYSKGNKQNTYVEVYYYNSSDLIATSDVINQEGYYKILLTNMNGTQDAFDLKVVNKNQNAYLEFDYIVDPVAAPGYGLFVYADAATAGKPYQNNWTYSALSLQETKATDSGGAIAWVRLAFVPQRNESLLVRSDVDLDILFEVSNWDNGWRNYTEIEGAAANVLTQNFDIGCEDVINGNCLVVYDESSSDNQLIAYRIWNASGLGAEQTFTINPVAALSDWIKLYPKDNSNNMMLAVGDDNLDLAMALWNGTSFEAPVNVTGALPLLDRKSFDFAWEGVSGDGLLVFGNTTNGVWGQTYASASKTWTNISGSLWALGEASTTYDVAVCGKSPLNAGLTHDYIGIIIQGSGDHVDTRIWNGSFLETLYTPPTADIAIEENYPVSHIDCAWESLSKNQAIFVYNDFGALIPESVVYTKDTSWSVADLTTGTATRTWSDDVESLRLTPNPANDTLMLYGTDLVEDSFCATWNGTGWDANGCGLIDATGTNGQLYTSIDFDWYRFDAFIDTTPPTIVFVSPTNTTYATGSLDYNATITDTAISVVLVSVDGGANITTTNDSATNFYNLTSQHSAITGQGLHNVTFFANNTNGYGNTSTIYFALDTTAPIITLPVYTNATTKKSNQTLILNISVTDATTTGSVCLIDVNGTNQTITFSNGWCNSSTIALTGLADGNKTINVWANDSANNWALNNSFVVNILNGFISTYEDSKSTEANSQRKLARNSTNAIHVVYTGADSKSYHRSSLNNGTTWSSENTVSTGTCADSSLAINSTDAIYIACGGGSLDDGLYVSTNNGVSWTEINTNANRLYPSLIIDSSNNLHLVHHSEDRDSIQYKNSSNNGVTWSSETSLATGDGLLMDMFPDIAIDSTGKIYVVWIGDAGDPDWDVFSNSYTSAGGWTGQAIVANTGGTAGGSAGSNGGSIVIDNSNNVHFVFEDNSDGENEIYYTKYTGSWSAVKNISLDNSLADTYPVITTNGTALWVIWRKATNKASLYYSNSTDAGTTWTTPVAYTDTTFADAYPSSIRNSTNSGGVDFMWTLTTPDTTYDIYYGNMSIGEGVGGADTTNPSASFGTNPINNYNDTLTTIQFDLKCSDNTAVNTLQLWGNWTGTWHANQTNSSPINNTFWNVSVSGIPEGKDHVWAAKCNDTIGNSDWTDTNRTFTIDFTAPIITLPVYTNATIKKNTDELILNISVIDSGVGFNPGDVCSVDIGGLLTMPTITNGWCNGSFGLTGLSDGNKTIRVDANDILLNAGTNQSFVVQIDTTAPVITLPVYANATKKSNTQTLTLNISLTDSTTSPSACLIDVNGTNQTIAFSNGWCNSSTIALTGLSNGNQTIKVWANDSANNWGLNNSFVVDIDSTAPTITLPVYTNATLKKNTDNLILNISVSDSGVGLSGGICLIDTNGTNQSVALSNGWCNSSTITLTGLTDGNKTINVWANDSNNNFGLNNSFVVQIDTTGPVITLPVYVNGTQKINTQTLTLNISLTDATTSPSACLIDVNGTNQTITFSNGWCNSSSIALTGLSTGNKTINVWANDSANNWGLNNSFVVDIIPNPNNAPNNPTPILLSIGGTNKTAEDLNCSSAITDADAGNLLNVSVRWYKNDTLNLTIDYNNNYANNTLFNSTLGNGNTSKGENWMCEMRLYDGTAYSNWVNSSNLTILNTLATVSLSGPAHGNTTTNRTPEFTWSGNDADSDSMTYEINLTAYYTGGGIRSACGVYVNNATLGSATNYIPSSYLKCLSDNNYFFNWTVRAWDSSGYGSWATERNISIQSDITISLPTSSVSFGNMNITNIDNTTDASPAPLILQNDGNAELNVSVNFTNLWNSFSNPSNYFQYKIRNLSTTCFILENTQTSWAQSPLTNTLAIHRLNFTSGYQTGCNNVSVDLLVEAPGDEISGNKNSNITFISSLGEIGYGAD